MIVRGFRMNTWLCNICYSILHYFSFNRPSLSVGHDYMKTFPTFCWQGIFLMIELIKNIEKEKHYENIKKYYYKQKYRKKFCQPFLLLYLLESHIRFSGSICICQGASNDVFVFYDSLQCKLVRSFLFSFVDKK